MAVTPADVAVTLGRPTPAADSPENAQWELWIGYAVRAIERRAERLGVDTSTLDPSDFDMVVTEAVAAKVKQPDKVRRVDIGIDDGRVGKEYTSASGEVTIEDHWWDLLFPDSTSGALSTRPSFEPDIRACSELWWL